MELKRGSTAGAKKPILLVFLCLVVLVTFPYRLPAASEKSNWVEVRSPHFIVDSNSGKNAAKATALQFEQIRDVLERVLPLAQSTVEPPLTILAVHDEGSMRRLLPGYFKKRGEMHPAGIFEETSDGAYIVFRTDIERPGVFEPVYHEYTHYLMRKVIPGMPLWLTEGLADFFSDTRLEGKYAFVGAPDAPDLSELRSTPLLPVKTLLAVDRSSPYYTREDKVGIFYAESWALTHYLLINDFSHHTHLVQQYEVQVANGGDPTSVFVKNFGPLSEIDHSLGSYVHHFTFLAGKLPFSKTFSSKTFAVRPLDLAEADTDQAGFLLSTGHSQEATGLALKAVAANPQLGAANAVMSSLLLRQGKLREASEWAEKAIKLDPNDFLGYLDDAYARGGSGANAGNATAVEEDLKRAISLRPDLSNAEIALSDLYLKRPDTTGQALAFALDAVHNDPENTGVLTNLEVILLKKERRADAVTIELRMLNLAHSPQGKAMVRNDLGWELLQQNVDPVRAEFEIRKAAQLDPKDADVIDSLGYLLKKKGDLAGAAVAYRQALTIQPKLVSSLEGLGDVLRAQHDLGGAITKYQAALGVNPNNANAHYKLSLALREKGDTTGAAKELNAARSLDPFNSDYK